jgi:hypothetical protein
MLDGLSRDGAEDPVDETRRPDKAMRLRVVDTLVHSRMAGNSEKQHLVNPKA